MIRHCVALLATTLSLHSHVALGFAPSATRITTWSPRSIVSSQPPPQPQQQHAFHSSSSSSSTSLNMLESFMDPSTVESMIMSASSTLDSTVASSSSMWLSFSDQGQNLAGIFFQASLLPYLLFLYFLSFRANRIPPLGNFGFQFVLLFVLSTIPSGIISKATYGVSLANCDWLHGGAEALLTIANILIVLGLKEALTKGTFTPTPIVTASRNYALAAFGLFAAACALGPGLLGFDAHSPFLLGVGDVPSEIVETLPWVTHSEPINALSIPTWMIHFSSVFEYLIGMQLVWDYSKTTQNPKWKGLTWGMLPLHASGICACTYHIFFNSMQFLVSMQAGLTLLGNVGCALAAFRIAKSNGWTLDEINPFPKTSTDPTGLIADGIASMPLQVPAATGATPAAATATETNTALLLKVLGLTVLTSYVVKYGELGADVFFTPNPPLALAMVLGIPALTAYNFYNLGEEEGGAKTNLFNFFNSDKEGDGKPALSMETIKQYGVAGTVAYVLTELAFWVVAFPVAAYALYESTGHWPDVITDNTDRAAVLAFIFAGANIARLMVPLRLGAALALAPWVDENILKTVFKEASTEGTTTASSATSSPAAQASKPSPPKPTVKKVVEAAVTDTEKKPIQVPSAVSKYFMTNKD